MAAPNPIQRRLIENHLVTKEQMDEALAIQKKQGGTLGEILVEEGHISEAQLLQLMAKEFNVLFIGSEKLARMDVPQAVLDLVPENIAREHNVLPMQYRKKDNTLFVAVNDPLNYGVIDEVKFASSIGKVKPVVCMASAIAQAVARLYGGEGGSTEISLGEDTGGGISLGGDEEAVDLGGGLDIDRGGEETVLAADGSGESAASQPYDMASALETADGSIDIGIGLGSDHDSTTSRGSMPTTLSERELHEAASTTKSKPAAAEVAKETQRVLLVEPHPKISRFLQRLLQLDGFYVVPVARPDQVVQALAAAPYDAIVMQEKHLGYGLEFESAIRQAAPRIHLSVIPSYGAALLGNTRTHERLKGAFTETLDVIVGLLEMGKESFRGHTHIVAKYCRLIAGKMGLTEAENDAIQVAAHLHDLGIAPVQHRSLFTFDEARDATTVEVPLKILTSVKFPLPVKEILLARFERWDGRGAPERLRGESIPAGARILSLVDAFQEQITDAEGRKAMDRNQAMQKILKGGGTLFDPAIGKVFLQVMEDEIKLGKLEASAERVAIVDTDAELTTLMGMKFVNEGFRVEVYTDGKAARDALKGNPPVIVLSEIKVPGMDGFSLCKALKENPSTANTPFVFISAEENPDDVTRGLEMGADDFISKPFKIDILFAKVSRIVERQRRTVGGAAKTDGVRGNLREMSLPDMIQILAAGRKTCGILIERGGQTADIHIEDGRIVNCIFGDQKGEEAFYSIVTWDEGTFALMPNVEITERLIDKSNDSLILEGFRRFDEAGRDGSEEDEANMEGDFL